MYSRAAFNVVIRLNRPKVECVFLFPLIMRFDRNTGTLHLRSNRKVFSYKINLTYGDATTCSYMSYLILLTCRMEKNNLS